MDMNVFGEGLCDGIAILQYNHRLSDIICTTWTEDQLQFIGQVRENGASEIEGPGLDHIFFAQYMRHCRRQLLALE